MSKADITIQRDLLNTFSLENNESLLIRSDGSIELYSTKGGDIEEYEYLAKKYIQFLNYTYNKLYEVVLLGRTGFRLKLVS